jgi:hypothetical protein
MFELLVNEKVKEKVKVKDDAMQGTKLRNCNHSEQEPACIGLHCMEIIQI